MFLFRVAFGIIQRAFKLGFLLVILAAIILVGYIAFWLPDVSRLKEINPETTAFIERTRARLRSQGSPTQIRQEWVSLDRVAPGLVEAVLVAEDDRFHQHSGFDLTEIRNAMEENYRAGKWVRGGSTITQQLAKNLYLSPEKSLRRKFDEMLLTWKLEKSLSKDRILEIYLNVVDWGGGCFGAEAASRYYFSKPASALTLSEAARLAARLPNPDGLSADRIKRREAMILARLLKKSPAHQAGDPAPVAIASAPAKPNPAAADPPRSATNPLMIERIARVGTDFRVKMNHFIEGMENHLADKARELQGQALRPVASQDQTEGWTLVPAPEPQTVSAQPPPEPPIQLQAPAQKPAAPAGVESKSGTSHPAGIKSKRLQEAIGRLEKAIGN
jgi:monofunctional biosynthetic peptidoglycan transglycosylase